MKIKASQDALLSNYEVYQHIVDQRERNKKRTRRSPKDVFDVTKEVISYLTTKPSPLHNQEETQAYSPNSMMTLMQKLKDAKLSSELTKGEMLTIVNLRPTGEVLLSNIVEDLESRFTEQERATILEIIIEVLGQDEPEEVGEEEEGEEAAEGTN
ncbi:RNA polymerase Rpb4-domain-containing protein [Podospora australis]|uniref:DNA-directed RNA polymerase III subunit RPC9 n=1 Tax=Podospora australis TaxID=1536484 RepID=A0AAN7ALL6_9PEZI|nr:RNA polymerase Rpb4-domain-containing protein [Podospora australis]